MAAHSHDDLMWYVTAYGVRRDATSVTVFLEDGFEHEELGRAVFQAALDFVTNDCMDRGWQHADIVISYRNDAARRLTAMTASVSLEALLAYASANVRRLEQQLACVYRGNLERSQLHKKLPVADLVSLVGSFLATGIQPGPLGHLYEIRPDGSDPLANMRMCCAVLAMEPGGILSDILEQLRSAEYRMVVRDISQDLYEITTGRHQDTQRRKRERETERTPFAQARTPRFLLSKVKEKGVVDLIGRFFSDSITPGDPVPIR